MKRAVGHTLQHVPKPYLPQYTTQVTSVSPTVPGGSRTEDIAYCECVLDAARDTAVHQGTAVVKTRGLPQEA